uniref:Uncharacterized protein n=1 Tax=Desertifilum tharense IPPAS B-1220 TaxID=1781255 RepID=A0ACD5GR85_9CYAN
MTRQARDFIRYKLHQPNPTELFIRRLEERIEQGEITIRVRSLESDRALKRVNLALKSTIYCCLTGFSCIAGAILLVGNYPGIAIALFCASGFFFLVLVRLLIELSPARTPRSARRKVDLKCKQDGYRGLDMTETAIDRLGEILWGAIALQSNAFQLIDTLPLSSRLAFLIVLLAGLSQAIGQGIILFMNRVKPSRFILSLFLTAILYAFGYIFWGLSTWLVCYLFFEQNASVFSVARVLGLAYAPELFSILIALPYLGVPISIILSIWTFLGFLTGMNAVLEMGM